MRPTSRQIDRRPARLIGALVGVALVAVAGIGPASAATATLGDLTFYGRGYGHGVGMSQYGARGRALAGQVAPTILAHYYPGTSIGSRNPATIVRVLLLAGFAATSSAPLTIIGTGGRWTIDGLTATFPAGARALLFPTTAGATTWTLRVRAADGTILHQATVSSAVMVRPAPGTAALPLGSIANRTVTRTATTTTYLQLASKSGSSNVYRGALRVLLGTRASVVNHVALDDYLRGVVPVEMPATWPFEALKAQAVAARSYAVAHLHPSTGTFDVYDDTRSQVYRGRNREAASTDLAISSSAGAVLLSGSVVANAVFHSADGGATENNENVWTSPTGQVVGTPLPYLRGSSDRAPDGASYDRASPSATWVTATYSAAKLSSMLGTDPRTNVGTLRSIGLTNRGPSGRLISITLTGSLGTKTVSGEVFRSVFNKARPATDPLLRSTLFATAPLP